MASTQPNCCQSYKNSDSNYLLTFFQMSEIVRNPVKKHAISYNAVGVPKEQQRTDFRIHHHHHHSPSGYPSSRFCIQGTIED